jgi:Fe-S cluster biosynthesis and repair protein YggX
MINNLRVTCDRFKVLPPKRYQVCGGLHNEADAQRLPAPDAVGKQVDNHVSRGIWGDSMNEGTLS